jgi:hypothetical protein
MEALHKPWAVEQLWSIAGDLLDQGENSPIPSFAL